MSSSVSIVCAECFCAGGKLLKKAQQAETCPGHSSIHSHPPPTQSRKDARLLKLLRKPGVLAACRYPFHNSVIPRARPLQNRSIGDSGGARLKGISDRRPETVHVRSFAGSKTRLTCLFLVH